MKMEMFGSCVMTTERAHNTNHDFNPYPHGIVFACKRIEQKEQLTKGVAQASGQIKEKQHDTVVKQRNAPHIVHIGISFAGKHTRAGMAYV